MSTEERRALEQEFDALVARIGAVVPADRKAGVIACCEELRRMTALARAETVHGVRSVALVADLPLGGGFDSLSFHIAGKPDPAPGKPFQALFNVASPGYFSTMGIPLHAGREFRDDDSG